MIKTFVAKDMVTGVIRGVSRGSEIGDWVPHGCEWVQISNGLAQDDMSLLLRWMVADNNNIVLRPVMSATINKTSILANGVDEAVISGVPVGAAVTIVGLKDGQIVATGDGSDIVVTLDYAVSIIVVIELEPFLKKEFTVSSGP